MKTQSINTKPYRKRLKLIHNERGGNLYNPSSFHFPSWLSLLRKFHCNYLLLFVSQIIRIIPNCMHVTCLRACSQNIITNKPSNLKSVFLRHGHRGLLRFEAITLSSQDTWHFGGKTLTLFPSSSLIKNTFIVVSMSIRNMRLVKFNLLKYK